MLIEFQGKVKFQGQAKLTHLECQKLIYLCHGLKYGTKYVSVLPTITC